MTGIRAWLQWLSAESGLAESTLAAALVLSVGLPLAFLVRLLVGSLVRRLTGPTNQSEASPLRATFADYHVDSYLARGAFWIIIIFTLMLGTELLGLPAVTSWLGGVAAYLPRVVAAVIVLVGGFVFGSLTQETLRRAATIGQFVVPEHVIRIIRLSIVGLAAIIALQQLGVRIGLFTQMISIGLAAFLGAGALAFGLGSRRTVSNILAGHYVRELYQVGQTVRIGDVEGRIVRITGVAVVINTKFGETAVPSRLFLDSPSTRLTPEKKP